MWDFEHEEDYIENVKNQQIAEILKGSRKNEKPIERIFDKTIYKQNNINTSSMAFYLANHLHEDIQKQ